MPPSTIELEPIGKANLIEALKDFQRLPIAKRTRTQVLKALRHPNASAASVSKPILLDPVLTLQLTMIVNEKLQPQGLEVLHFSHALSLLGLPNVEQKVKQSAVFEHNDFYEEQLNQAYMSADLAQRLSQLTTANEAEYLFLSTLGVRAQVWGLWLFYPETMQKIEQLKANPENPRESIEQLALGISIDELGTALLAHWHLPKLSQKSVQLGFNLVDAYIKKVMPQTDPLSESVALHDLPNGLQEKSALALLSAYYTAQGCMQWQSPETLISQNILASNSSAPLEKIVAESRQTIIRCPFKGWYQLHPAARLLQHWSFYRTLILLKLQTTQIDKPQPAVDEDPPMPEMALISADSIVTENPRQRSEKGNSLVLKANLHRLSDRGNQFKNLNQLMLVTLNSLNEGAGIEDVVIFIRDNLTGSLKPNFSVGFEPEDPIKSKELSTQEINSGLLHKLLQQPAGLHITDQNRQQATQQVPKILAQQVRDKNTAFMSIFYNRKPIAIIMGSDDFLDQISFQQFKRVCNATSKAIQSFGLQKKRKKHTTD